MRDKELFEKIKSELFSAVVGDVLDTLGHRQQFLPQPVKPLVPGSRLVGRAMPVLEAQYGEAVGKGPLSDKPFGIMFEALDSLGPGDIYIASGRSLEFALWGGLMSTRAQHLNAAGAILDGYIRDTEEIKRLGFTVFSRGSYAQDQGVRGKVLDYGVPIEVGSTTVTPGDLLFADDEGVVVIPQGVEEEAVELAFAKVATESEVAIAIGKGMSSQDAFKHYGVM